MTDGTFEKVRHSDSRLYGPEKLLLCGFPAPAQPKFMAVLEMAGLDATPVVWVDEPLATQPVSALLDLPPGSGTGNASTLPRAIVVSGITENQLHTLMAICRQAGMQQALWAVLTPVSEKWPLSQLLAELTAERKALSKSSQKGAS